MVPFGPTHSFGVQTQGEFIGYHERYEGELDAGLLNRWKWLQGGVFKHQDGGDYRRERRRYAWACVVHARRAADEVPCQPVRRERIPR